MLTAQDLFETNRTLKEFRSFTPVVIFKPPFDDIVDIKDTAFSDVALNISPAQIYEQSLILGVMVIRKNCKMSYFMQ